MVSVERDAMTIAVGLLALCIGFHVRRQLPGVAAIRDDSV
jgi:hypothetical protein